MLNKYNNKEEFRETYCDIYDEVFGSYPVILDGVANLRVLWGAELLWHLAQSGFIIDLKTTSFGSGDRAIGFNFFWWTNNTTFTSSDGKSSPAPYRGIFKSTSSGCGFLLKTQIGPKINELKLQSNPWANNLTPNLLHY